ncbi:hypothetical protein ACP70R_002900 [Stipagrostis hirtigluma subsp. patula]
MMASVQVSLLAVAAAVMFAVASGASYTVGEPGGSWDTQTNLTAWASSIVFHSGDQLVFKYSPAAHDVVEVRRDGYLSCSAAKPVSVSRTGRDTVQLTAVGRRYFICGVPGHCAAGMRLRVSVLPAGCSSPSPAVTNGSPSWNGNGTPGGVCLGDSPTTIVSPSYTSDGPASASSCSVTAVLVTMVFLLGLMF